MVTPLVGVYGPAAESSAVTSLSDTRSVIDKEGEVTSELPAVRQQLQLTRVTNYTQSCASPV